MLLYTSNFLFVHEWASILPGHIHVRPNMFIRSEASCVAFHSVNDKGDRIIMRQLHIFSAQKEIFMRAKKRTIGSDNNQYRYCRAIRRWKDKPDRDHLVL